MSSSWLRAPKGWLVVGLWLSVSQLGCAKSHDVALDGGGEGGSSGAGEGGEGGSSGEGGAGTGGAPMCVASECEGANLPFPIPGLTITGCCTDQDECGLSASAFGDTCMQRDAPGTNDPACPSQSLMGFNAPGCCTADGVCGVRDTFIGFGCVAFGGDGASCGGGAGNGGNGGGGAGGNAGSGGQGGGNACDNCPALGPFAGLAGVTPCCTTEGECGGNFQNMCIALDQEGEVSNDCDPVSLMGFELDGCCRPDGTCGALDTFIGFGCAQIPGSGGTCDPGVIPD